MRKSYFSAQHGTLRVSDRLSGLVEVRRHNLVTDRSPPLGSAPFDLILCRNVLIYFDPATADRVVASLRSALWPGGRLLLGAADRLSGRRPQMTVARSPDRPAPSRRRTARSAGPNAGPSPASVVNAPNALNAGNVVNAEAQRQRLSDARAAADRGDLDTALSIAGAALAEDPLDAEAHFIKGVAELARHAPVAAVDSLRRALYTDPTSTLVAFHLARAHDALGEQAPARRAYGQVLRTLELDRGERSVAQQRDRAEITEACRARLAALARTR